MATGVLEPVEVNSDIETISDRVARLAREAQAVGIEFFMASSTAMHDVIGNTPFGIHLHRVDVMRETDHQEWSSTAFLKLFNQANGYAFGPRGLPMPYWVMLDLALLPSGVVIAGASAATIRKQIADNSVPSAKAETLVQLLDAAEDMQYEGPIPIAGYCAAPTAESGRWAGWSLWSILPGLNLGLVAKGLALEAYGARVLDGTTQFDNESIRIHAAFGPLRIRSARLSIHTSDNAFVYECNLTKTLGLPHAPSFLLDPSDVPARARIQQRIDASTHDYYILPPGAVASAERSYLPILEVERSAAEEFIDVTR